MVSLHGLELVSKANELVLKNAGATYKGKVINSITNAFPPMALNTADQLGMSLYGRVTECHMFSRARNTVLYPGTVILIGNEDRGTCMTAQTAFQNAEDITIYGGFYGTEATKAALQHAKLGMQPYGEVERVLRREEAALRQEESALQLQFRELGKRSGALRRFG